MTDITIITSEFCSNCEHVKELLNENGINYKTADVEDSDTLSELLLAPYTDTNLPILKINGKFYNKDLGLQLLIGC